MADILSCRYSQAMRGIRVVALAMLTVLVLAHRNQGGEPAWMEVRIVDAEDGRGIPLAELETVHGVIYVTDNAGRIALSEPEFIGRELFFYIRSHGYEAPRDGFGFAGTKIEIRPGSVVRIPLRRQNVAQRLCRLTGEERFRDSNLLGCDDLKPEHQGGHVAGQDSIQAAVYKEHVYWVWGDTSRLEYPLGLFRSAGATTALVDLHRPNWDPSAGISYRYFVGKDGFVRAMMPLPERPEGVIWLDGLCVVPDESGKEKLIAHYSRRKGLDHQLEQGIAVFNDATAEFESILELPLTETWRFPHGHPNSVDEDGQHWLYFGSSCPNVRVGRRLPDILNRNRYEALTCQPSDGQVSSPKLDPKGASVWRWQRTLPPVDSTIESKWINHGEISVTNARFCPVDVDSVEDFITLHNGTVRWNEFRKRWILIAGQIHGKPSTLGEVWYAESEQLTGPFKKAVRIVTHQEQTFYNVCHHPFLDQRGGRTIYFEGTYTNAFSGNPAKTPRYDYNQILYKLDLDARQLKRAH